jgi:hypothetical protein
MKNKDNENQNSKNPSKISKEKADAYFKERNRMIVLISSGLYCPECRGSCLDDRHTSKIPKEQ